MPPPSDNAIVLYTGTMRAKRMDTCHGRNMAEAWPLRSAIPQAQAQAQARVFLAPRPGRVMVVLRSALYRQLNR